MRDRKMQQALMQFFEPDNWFSVREVLIEPGRQNLIGSGAIARSRPIRPKKPSKVGGGNPTAPSTAETTTTTTLSPTRQRVNLRGSAGYPVRCIDRAASRRSGNRAKGSGSPAPDNR
jgi:hypothetical protein